jgi:hypothetical protein
MWKVGNVMSVNVADGAFGFNLTTDRGKPLVLFSYEKPVPLPAGAGASLHEPGDCEKDRGSRD